MVIIVDDKSMRSNLPPPPPYLAAGPVSPPPFPGHFPRQRQTLATLPSHLLLQIVYATFPKTAAVDEGKSERQRKTLYWLSTSLRLVNRALYIACMHVLRSTYLPAYQSLIRPPYTSDPFPYTASTSSNAPMSPVNATQRETAILDRFITLKVREDVWLDESELHLEREDSFKDLFDLMQPKSRLEDLVRSYGVRDGVIVDGANGPAKGKGKARSIDPIPFDALSVSFSTRTAGLVMTTRTTKRTIVQVPRTRDEKLEIVAKRLVRELRNWLEG
ncbi:hypothetical protein OE88DRAFT_1666493 [Heliocybe sulcata]|uniref:Uncharacterized protein n=1 Tax=Heliocybe sulcata TaxID=5364 RepID=A0A5C3MQF2_9AGAM|nr:hypothetical protein OE88DRAFT_1666493 [Heliocybe sulcata]